MNGKLRYEQEFVDSLVTNHCLNPSNGIKQFHLDTNARQFSGTYIVHEEGGYVKTPQTQRLYVLT